MSECAQEHLVDGNQMGAANDLHLLGMAYRELKQYTEALEILKRAEALANSAAVQLHLAQAYNGLNRKSDAIGALENASKLNPDPQTKASMDELAKALK
jgi:tetratricopeptide (TPR) repeat protein